MWERFFKLLFGIVEIRGSTEWNVPSICFFFISFFWFNFPLLYYFFSKIIFKSLIFSYIKKISVNGDEFVSPGKLVCSSSLLESSYGKEVLCCFTGFRDNFLSYFRSSRPELFCKKGVLRNFAKFIGKSCARVSFSKFFFSRFTLTVSFIMLENGQTYFRNLAVFIPQDY